MVHITFLTKENKIKLKMQYNVVSKTIAKLEVVLEQLMHSQNATSLLHI